MTINMTEEEIVALNLDIASAMIEKNRFNRERADHKLANRSQDGGKKY